MKTILIIGYVWPEPHSSAAGSHMLSLIRLFKNTHWRVIFSTPAQKTDFCVSLEKEGVEEKTIQVNSNSFDGYISELTPTLVLFDRFLMEEQFGWRVEKYSPSSLRVLDTEDFQCLRGARHEALKQNKIFDVSDLNSDLAKREIASIYRCDLSLIISSFEMQLLIQHFSIDPSLLIHIPFMLDKNQFNKTKLAYKNREHFITIGNLRHAPNWDSVLFLQTIWPKIRNKLPNAEMHIYGAYTPPKAAALNNPKTGFIIKDRASDVNEVMERARVCLSPLRFGAGIKGKFVDAMLNKTPIITTSIGAEGMIGEKSADKTWPGFVENELDDIVEKAITLYQEQSVWNEKVALGQQLLHEEYDGKVIGENLLNRIETVIDNIELHRRNNFIGAMMHHHSLRSTEFMARWIEEKSKK